MTSSSFRKLVEPGERTPTSNVWWLVRRRRKLDGTVRECMCRAAQVKDRDPHLPITQYPPPTVHTRAPTHTHTHPHSHAHTHTHTHTYTHTHTHTHLHTPTLIHSHTSHTPLPHILTHKHTLRYPKPIILVLKITLVVELWPLWSSCQPSVHFDFRWQLSGQVHEDSAMNAVVHRPLDAKTHPGGKVVSTVLMCSFWPPLLARFDRRAGSSCVMCINLNKPPTRSVVATRKKNTVI